MQRRQELDIKLFFMAGDLPAMNHCLLRRNDTRPRARDLRDDKVIGTQTFISVVRLCRSIPFVERSGRQKEKALFFSHTQKAADFPCMGNLEASRRDMIIFLRIIKFSQEGGAWKRNTSKYFWKTSKKRLN
jgi:hypothetical protein